ncbi:4Fe-4S binding protein [Flavonifractor sp. DFI.6.63]|uniref:4Fe-4S dicluster domain-containing protein n=1 Tax=Flavonifractor sp. DFI.6.63 TaxID=2963704 RepID=UPI0021091F5D|nr:4Fe-4S binding protein [Flavonifractor sp. DFI.6.63]MCQ5029623.1 4Fe-4S binding protein [Flavonifractor sp. DFI.6.63]
MAQITINEKRCKRCGYCIAFCPTKVYGQEIDGLPRVEKLDKCTACQMCVKRCPDFAIRVED